MNLTLCSLLSLYSGEWRLGAGNISGVNPWKACPHLSTVELYSEQRDRYSCLNHPYRTAHYETHECSLLSLHESILRVRHHCTKTKVVYVGDSLSKQLSLAAQCHAEENHGGLDFIYIGDPFLREDYPCNDECVSNSTFLQEQFRVNDVFSNKCAGCLMGVRDAYNSTTRVWLRNVPVSETLALVLNGGAWFSTYKGIGDPSIFNDTLHKVGQAAEYFSREHKIPLIWISLPPIPLKYSEPATFRIHPTWLNFHDYNQWAEHILPPYGVTFIDMERLLMQRKAMNPNVSADGIHWCNPGTHSVPVFINRIIFHFLASHLLDKKKVE